MILIIIRIRLYELKVQRQLLKQESFNEYLFQMMQYDEENKIMRKQKIKRLLESDQFLQMDRNFEDVVCFTEQIEPSQENLKLIIKLVSSFGLTIAIFLKSFYSKMQKDPSFVETNKKSIRKIIGHINRLTDGKPIEQLKFMQVFEAPKKKDSKIELNQDEKKFLMAIEEVTLHRKQIESIKNINELQKQVNQYSEFMENIKQKYQLLQSDCVSIERYGFSNQELSQLFGNLSDIGSSKLQQSVISNQNYYSNFVESKLLESQQVCEKRQSRLIQEQKIENNSPKRDIFNDYLCCRSYFEDQQKLSQLEDKRKTFLFSDFPFQREFSDTLARVTCSFLNEEGGVIYIGFLKTDSQYKAVGLELCEGQRQAAIKTIRLACQQIQPDIIAQKMYNIDFIPIMKSNRFVIKIWVKYGIRSQIYSFRQNNKDYFPFREGSTIFQIDGRQLMDTIKARFNCNAAVPEALHNYPCRKPLIVDPVYKQFKDHQFDYKLEKKPIMLTEKKKDSHHNFNYFSEQAREKKSVKQQKKNVSEFKLGGQGSIPMKKSKQLPSTKEVLQNSNKEQGIKIGYFYLTGLSIKNINLLLEKNSLSESTMVSQSDKGGFLLTVRQTKACEKMRKMLKKLEKKYFNEHLVKFQQVSLELNIPNLKKGIMEIRQKKLNCQYSIKGDNILKFKFYKDSLRVFLTLSEKGLFVKFQI